MGDQRKGGISWTDQTWNPVRGCSRVSAGCQACYAESMAARFSGPGQPYEGLAKMTPSGARWTGEVRLVDEHLADPLRWKRPRRVFVNSMSDLFHEGLAEESIRAVFGIMARASRHTFQVLTKRPARMVEIMESWRDAGLTLREGYGVALPNVWLGVSVEDQKTANERIPLLLQCPAAVRFVSYEPALGSVDFRPWLGQIGELGAWTGFGQRLDWVIVGGESGPGARPFDLAWARSTIEQCRAAGVACFVKQLGARPTTTWSNGDLCDQLAFRDRAGSDPAEWPTDLRVQQFPEVAHASA